MDWDDYSNKENNKGDKMILVGYVRKSNKGNAIKLSINKQSLKDCEVFTTSDGQQYIALVISIAALRKVLDGENAVTTISQIEEE